MLAWPGVPSKPSSRPSSKLFYHLRADAIIVHPPKAMFPIARISPTAQTKLLLLRKFHTLLKNVFWKECMREERQHCVARRMPTDARGTKAFVLVWGRRFWGGCFDAKKTNLQFENQINRTIPTRVS
jgi:hypothetical protein